MRIQALCSFALVGCVGAAPSSPNTQKDAAVGGGADSSGPAIDAPTTTFSFFITSTGGPTGGDLRANVADADGLAGADALCQSKAAAAVPASASKTWRAYLSTSTVNARSRIGTGPWFNVSGVMVATSVDNLHDAAGNNVNKLTALDETGATVNGSGDTPNTHDILTGSPVDRHGCSESLQQLDKLRRYGGHGERRPPRSHGRWCRLDLVGCGPRDQRLFGHCIPGQRRARVVLLLRRELTLSAGSRRTNARWVHRSRAARPPRSG